MTGSWNVGKVPFSFSHFMMSQQTLADVSHVSPPSISEWSFKEKGHASTFCLKRISILTTAAPQANVQLEALRSLKTAVSYQQLLFNIS